MSSMTEVRERPILFSGPMVQALLAGRKTQTRRVVKPQPRVARYGPSHPTHPNGVIGRLPGTWGGGDYHVWKARPDHDVPLIAGSEWAIERYSPYGVPGDRLWVREAWAYYGGNEMLYQREHGAVQYRATHESDHRVSVPHRVTAPEQPEGDRRWRPSIHMPRWASRITLEVVDVRVERVQDISEADAIAEGCAGPGYGTLAVLEYCRLWDEINGKGAWADNPWVWVVEFRRINQ